MTVAYIVVAALVSVFGLTLLLGRRLSSALEKIGFFSALLGFSATPFCPLVILGNFSLGGAQQSFEVTPDIVIIAFVVAAWASALACSTAMMIKRRAPNNSFKPTPLRGAA